MKIDSKVIKEILNDLENYTVGRPNDEQVHITVKELTYQMNKLSKLINKNTSFGFESKDKICKDKNEINI